MRRLAAGVFVLVIQAFTPHAATAQQEFIKDKTAKMIAKIGVHVSSSFADPLDTKQASRDGSYGVSVGLAPGKANGWRYPFGIAWFTEELVAPNGTTFSQLRARPVYGGIGYGWHFGQRWSIGAQVQAGWS